MNKTESRKWIVAAAAAIILGVAAYALTREEPPYDPAHAEQVTKGIEEFLGKGYKGYQYYANPDSCTLVLFDLSDEKHVDIQKAPSWKGRFASGENKTEFYDEFFAEASVSGVYDGFSGEITSNFNSSTLRNRAHSFATANIAQTYYRLTLLDTARLKKEVSEDLMTMVPAGLFEKYGTHYLKSIYIGGRISFSSFVDRSQVSKNFSLEATVNASYAEVVKGSASGGTVAKEDIEQVTRNKKIVVKGGDPAKSASIQDGAGNPSENYAAWSESVPRYMSISDTADGGMVPIYELVDDQQRRAELEAAWTTYMAAKTADVLKEGEPEVILKNANFVLKGEDGRYFGEAPYNRFYRYYYPTVSSKASVTLKLDSGTDALETDHNVQIKTTETFKGSWAGYTYLGAFKLKKWLYYWIPFGAKTNWIVEKVIPSSDPRVRYGDAVRIRNEHFAQYLAPSDDGFLTTVQTPFVWTVKAVEQDS